MPSKRVLITAGLPYSNGMLHVGHIAGCYLPADIHTRYLRRNGYDVRFVCGSDDHGVAIMMTALAEGKSPAEVAQYYHARQAQDFNDLQIEFDIYGSTSQSPYHENVSQNFFNTIYKKGFFEKRETEQFFDIEQNIFLPDRFVTGECGLCGAQDQNSDQCENCGALLDTHTLKNARSAVNGSAVIPRKTTHWFLDLSQFKNDVTRWLNSAKLREHTRTYVSSLISEGLVKRSMTRDIDWGIPLPIDDPEAAGKVMYVWFDAPIAYISNTMELCATVDGDPDAYADWWKNPDSEIVHFVGEDNTIFHCIIWIAMLTAEGTFQLPSGVIVNKFLNIQAKNSDSEKISKSRGNAVWVNEYISNGGDADSLRYYLTSISPERVRTAYNHADLIQRHNSDLANTLGNFIHRSLTFTYKHFGDEIAAPARRAYSDIDEKFVQFMHDTFTSMTDALDNHSTKQALEKLMDFCRQCNKYFDAKQPWVAIKSDPDATRITLWICLDAVRFIAVALSPFLPAKSEKIAQMIKLDLEATAWRDAICESIDTIQLNKPVILFPVLTGTEKQA